MKLLHVLLCASQLCVSLAASVKTEPPYNASLPPFPILYSDAEKSAQFDAGVKLTNDLNNLFEGLLNGSYTKKSYTVAPGVYRITARITMPNIQNFKLVMSHVEIITTTNDASFWFFGPNNVEIAGPLYFEADPLPNSQGVIVGTDMNSYVDIQVMDGYQPPIPNVRIMAFTPDGVLQPHWQDSASNVTDLGNGTYRMTFSSYTFDTFPESTAQYFKIGNLFSVEGGPRESGGFNLQGVGNLYMHQIYHYASNLIFCQNTQGTLRLDQWMGQRRPGTNRLNAGGWMQCQYDGGLLEMTNSEISYNYDDLTDFNGYLSAALSGPTPSQLYLYAAHIEVGRQFQFYDSYSIADMGAATIVSIDNDTVTSQAVIDRANNATAAAQMHTITDGGLALVTMSADVTGNSGLYLVDDVKSRPIQLSIRNSFLHDSLAAGISLRSAHSVVITGNTVQRAGISCINSGFSAYWLEGGPAANILINNNTCIDSPYSLPVNGVPNTPIRTFTEYEQMVEAKNSAVIRNITITGNTIIRPQSGAIEVMLSESVNIHGNTVIDPFSFPFAENQWTLAPWVISAQTSSQISVMNNVVYRSNTSDGINATNLVVANDATTQAQVRLGGNAVYTNGVKDKVSKYIVGLQITYPQ